MSLFGGLKSQLRSVIQWENPHSTILFERWSENGDELKNCSKLIVGPGQGCLFVYEGKVQAMHVEEGVYELKTANIPFWTTLTKFMQGFVSEHKVGIYFFKTTKLLDQKWGTQSTIKYLDPQYKFPVGLRVFGNYTFRLKNPDHFFHSVIGQQNPYKIESIRDVLTSRLVQPLTDSLATSKFSYADIDSNRNEIATSMMNALTPEFDSLGFIIEDFRIEGTSFDEDTMKRINRIADISAEAQAAQVAGVNFAQLQQLDAMKEAAKNPSGGAGVFMGMGIGANLGGQIAATNSNLANAPTDPAIKLKKLKDLLDQGLITTEEYDAKKKEILAQF